VSAFFRILPGLFAVVCASAEIPMPASATQLDPGWKWIREDRSAWRLTNGMLEVRIQPGNMWGPANDAKNVLTIPVPQIRDLEIAATVENKPTEQYEQVDLVWYYADSHMVKIGQELVDGKLSVVMGREEGDRTRTMSINPIEPGPVEVRFLVAGGRINGQYRNAGQRDWKDAGNCSLPVLEGVQPRISLQFYQGPAKAEHWGRVLRLTIRRPGEANR
jgi:regulation of enolase protein 1 (concanavalin A-like superfamily)